ncbi:chalcone isomerase family protein [Massilia sp. B-10]|nr:chalcone isomerase family protein [Massilia sp. B-10]UUZ54557.1 chalcone isomerase family protein [Massilia sp. H-1]
MFCSSINRDGEKMTAVSKYGWKMAFAGMFFMMAAGQVSAAVDVAGIKYEESVSLGGKQLVLNGAGVRNKFTVKVYAAGLYLQDAQTTVDGVMKADGPRRMHLVMLRDISADDLGSAFMVALTENINPADKAKIVTQISKYGEMFSQVSFLKKGDTIDTDWIPGVGNQCYVNGKKVGPVIPDILFYNSVLRVWLGDKPVDSALKAKLLVLPAKK